MKGIVLLDVEFDHDPERTETMKHQLWCVNDGTEKFHVECVSVTPVTPHAETTTTVSIDSCAGFHSEVAEIPDNIWKKAETEIASARRELL